MSRVPANIALFDRTYDETLALLEHTRAVMSADRARSARDGVAPLALRESFRVTTRLTQILSWLMARRAVALGELTARDARRHVAWRLGAREICRDRSGQAAEDLPEALRDLLDRSYKLYVRVARLDGLIDRDATG